MNDNVESARTSIGIHGAHRLSSRKGTDVLPICRLTLRASKPKDTDYPHDPITLGQHIKKRRMDLRLLQREIGAKIGVDACTVWNWENDRAEPEFRFLPAILDFLGYDPRTKPTSIGGHLLAYRLARGWARPRLAAELRVDPSTLAGWETGKRHPWGIYVDRVDALLSGAHGRPQATVARDSPTPPI